MSKTLPERPRRADAVRNRARLLLAADEVFAERGLGVTLDDVAHHAGVGVGTVYRHFPDKDELIDAVFEQNFSAMADAAEEATAGDDPWHAFAQYLEFACEKMAASRGMTEVLYRSGCQRAQAQSHRVEAAVARLVQRAHDSGALRPDAQPDDFFAIVFSVGALADATRQSNPHVWRRHLALLLDGLNNDRRPRRPLPAESPTGPATTRGNAHHAVDRIAAATAVGASDCGK